MRKDIIELYGTTTNVPEDGFHCKTYNLENETGTGIITVYHILKGMKVVYNDMHMAYCNQNQNGSAGIIEINHCREGRYECNVGNQSCCYMTPGDLSFGSLKRHITKSCFPLNHYHGISIFIEIKKFK